MPDVVAITAGTGTNISTDERTIASVVQHVQRVNDIGGSAIANGQVTIGTTAATVVAARDTRKRVTILSHSTNTGVVYVGVATVTTANGFRLDAGSALTVQATALVQGIASAAGQVVSYLEEYDA